MRVVVAMSGGVDSSVAAALLARGRARGRSGCRCSSTISASGETAFGSCCTIDDLHDARRVAAAPRHPPLHRQFRARSSTSTVVANFVSEYAAGRTPIPCVHCNGDLKFATLVGARRGLRRGGRRDRPLRARRARRGDGPLSCSSAALDPAKDQSYFLFTLDPGAARARDVSGRRRSTRRRCASRRARSGLPVADKPDSHEICFVAGRRPRRVRRAARRRRRPAGPIRDVDGRVRRHARRRPSLHRRPAQGARPLLAHPALRRRHRRGRRTA